MRIILLLIIILILNSCMAGYAMKAATGHLSILWKAVPIEVVLADETTEEAVKERLRHVLEVREYAEKHLALKPGSSFTEYASIGRKAVAWNVTASEKLQLKAKTWYFPFVGSVPYIGFYSEEEANAFARDLEKQGYDVLVSEVPAYSTLGWFSDPVLSSQIAYPEWYLTRLVIHESVHSTVWIPGDVSFNESLASYAELEGSIQFYREKKGENDPFFQKYMLYIKERKQLNEFLILKAQEIHKLYAGSAPEEEKILKKEEFIENFRKELVTVSSGYHILRPQKTAEGTINNAFFLSFLRYDSGEDHFSELFEKSGRDWPRFFEKIRNLSEEERNLNRLPAH